MPWPCLTTGSIRVSGGPGSQETWLGLAVPTDRWLSVLWRQRKLEVRSEWTKAETSPTVSKELPNQTHGRSFLTGMCSSVNEKVVQTRQSSEVSPGSQCRRLKSLYPQHLPEEYDPLLFSCVLKSTGRKCLSLLGP